MTPEDERELFRIDWRTGVIGGYTDSPWLYVALGVVGVSVWVLLREFGWL